MKKEFEHKPKNSPPRKGEDGRNGFNKNHLPAQSLYECAPLTSGLA